MDIQSKKIELDQPKDLGLYIFTIQKGIVNVEVNEDLKCFLAETDEEAYTLARKEYPMGVPLVIKKRGRISMLKMTDEIKNILSVKFTPPAPAPESPPITSKPIPTKEKTVTDFINGLLLITDKYVVDKRDRSTLKRIINKINLHEDQTIIEPVENAA